MGYVLRVFEGFWFFIDNIWMYSLSKGKVQPPREFSLIWLLEGKDFNYMYWFVAVWKALFTIPGDFCLPIKCKLSSFHCAQVAVINKVQNVVMKSLGAYFCVTENDYKSSSYKYDFVKMFQQLTKLDITESKQRFLKTPLHVFSE